MKKVLFAATVVKTHINAFHLPYLNWFSENGWQTFVAAKDDYKPSECIIPSCDQFIDIPFVRFPFHPKNFRAYRMLKKLIEKEKFDIIHCHTPVGSILTRLAARRARKKFGTKVIYTAHGFHFFKGAPKLNWLLFYPAEKLCARWCDLLITINGEDFERAKKKLKAKKVVYVPGVGVDTARFAPDAANRDAVRDSLGIPRDVKLFISVGELLDRKNHIAALRALEKAEDQTARYIVVGSGPNLEKLTALKNETLAGRVDFLGFRKDIPALLAASDCLLFPSLQEGLPLAVMEAMAVGLPVIASPIRGCRDLIVDGKGGILTDCNDPAAFAKAIDQISLQDREKIAAFNRERIKKFDVRCVLSEVTELYREMEKN